ncbi:proline and serine-rich protein 1-like isoform X1 [Phaenicophaeus curvirostris]|uniref:proline and serine-rich protein 1-like isoform X1 n=1 Tax=Phaenicophaeus curvirostris TaxID=33595 RepID=UPI0037F0C266
MLPGSRYLCLLFVPQFPHFGFPCPSFPNWGSRASVSPVRGLVPQFPFQSRVPPSLSEPDIPASRYLCLLSLPQFPHSGVLVPQFPQSGVSCLSFPISSSSIPLRAGHSRSQVSLPPSCASVSPLWGSRASVSPFGSLHPSQSRILQVPSISASLPCLSFPISGPSIPLRSRCSQVPCISASFSCLSFPTLGSHAPVSPVWGSCASVSLFWVPPSLSEPDAPGSRYLCLHSVPQFPQSGGSRASVSPAWGSRASVSPSRVPPSLSELDALGFQASLPPSCASVSPLWGSRASVSPFGSLHPSQSRILQVPSISASLTCLSFPILGPSIPLRSRCSQVPGISASFSCLSFPTLGSHAPVSPIGALVPQFPHLGSLHPSQS